MASIGRLHKCDDVARNFVEAVSACSILNPHRNEGHEIDRWRSAFAHMQRLEKLIAIEVRGPALRTAEDRVGCRRRGEIGDEHGGNGDNPLCSLAGAMRTLSAKIGTVRSRRALSREYSVA